MQINELLLKNFGKFHDRQINLEEGINLIHGENESGKSTIHTFIKGMLFGIERGRGRAAQNDTFSIYEPWDNPNYYSGTLKFASGGKHFRIERNFDKYSKKAELVCIEDGEVLSVEDGDLRMLLGEMNVDRYENTVSMSQRNAQMGESMAMELKNYATNYYTSGNGEIDLNGALEQLKGRKKVLENEIRMEMSRKQQKREKLEQEVSFIWRDVHHLEEELDRVEEELEYRAGKEEEKRKERQLEGEHGKGVMDEIRPEKWRIHPMEILIFALVIVAASDHTFETMELSGGDCTVPCIWPVCMEPDESRKETGKDGTGDHFGRDHAGRRKGSDREVTVGKGPYYRRTERKNNSV